MTLLSLYVHPMGKSSDSFPHDSHFHDILCGVLASCYSREIQVCGIHLNTSSVYGRALVFR